MSNRQISTQSQGGMALLMGLIFMAVGGLIILMALEIIPMDPSSLHAPRWVLGAAGALFFLSGALVFLQGIAGPDGEHDALMRWVQYVLVLGAMVAFSSVFLWVGFGPGEREFQTTTSVGPLSVSGQGNDVVGRCLFGGFGVLTALGTVYYAFQQLIKILNLSGDGDE
ncbi:MAG: hypothetical protein HN413_14030 [Chloroflexi bacterium]|nr:hypothetical protein [Chloroflexota bacterium]